MGPSLQGPAEGSADSEQAGARTAEETERSRRWSGPWVANAFVHIESEAALHRLEVVADFAQKKHVAGEVVVEDGQRAVSEHI